MKYDHFIETLKKFQTQRIKVISFPQSCAIENIPQEFDLLLSDIVHLLDKNITYLCNDNEIIALFGMQFGPPMLQSELPLTSNRIFNHKYPQEHFCCVLQYLVCASSTIASLQSWQGMQSIVLDFTSGLVMDGNCYIDKFHNRSSDGIIFGEISHHKLSKTWNKLNHRTKTIDTDFLSNNFLVAAT